jgi:LuxR family maltose regulon positive regulatory protein
VDDWLRRLGDGAVAAHPQLALVAAVCRLVRGERDAAEQLALVAGDGPGAALIHAWGGRGDVAWMAAAAGAARAATPDHGPWRSLACLVEGSAHCLAGRTADAVARLDEGARCAIFDAPLLRSLCLAQLALVALQDADAEDGAALAARARSAVAHGDGADHPLAALTDAVSALAHVQRGRLDAAREDRERATGRLAALPDPPPWYGALTRAVLARVQLKLSDLPDGRRLLSEASRLRRQAHGAVALQAWIDAGWGLADDYAAGPVAYPSTLTLAELRVLRLLPSHLTFREIGTRLHVSANTIKTQAHAVYRKLDARSRSEAVAHAAAIGLVET